MWRKFIDLLEDEGFGFIVMGICAVVGMIIGYVESEKELHNQDSSLAVDTPVVSYPNPELDRYYTEEARKQAINDTLEKLQEKMEYVNKEKEIERLRLQLNK